MDSSMATMKDTNGKVNVTDGVGIFSSDAAQNKLTGTTIITSVSLASVIRTVLDLAADAVSVIYNTSTRLIAACGNSTDVTSALSNTAGTKTVTFKPVSGQTGRSLKWEQDGQATNGFDSGTLAAVQDLIAPVVPAYSAEAFAQRLAQAIPDNKDAIILVDQVSGKVSVSMNTNLPALQEALLTVITGAGDYAEMQMSEPPAGGTANPLVFEGGTVS